MVASTDAADQIVGTVLDEAISGGGGGDTLEGGAGSDTIDGGAGNDSLQGDDGNDLLQGGSGHDALYGGSGNDTLVGGAGDDQLSGGEGADTFVFGRGSAIDWVSVGVRVDTATDRIELSGLNAVDVDMQRDGADLVINVRGSTDTLQVTGYFEGEGATNEVNSPKNET